MQKLSLISHVLCPYVQRAVISLSEKAVPFQRIDIDLSNKPDWFLKLSPLGKTPVLQIGERAIFESAVILEYLEETKPFPLHPGNPEERAEHRAWIEFGSTVLAGIANFYSAVDAEDFLRRTKTLEEKFAQIEQRLSHGPYFDGKRFSLVDVVFGPVFRYFDVFDRIADFGVFAGKPKVAAWRNALALRPSIRDAVSADYEQRLWTFLEKKNSHLTTLMAK
jgi:glutathione S-transferase